MRPIRACGLLLLMLPTALGSAPAPRLDAARLDELLSGLAVRGFAGVVHVRQGRALLLHKGYGIANRATGDPFKPDTIVQIGSNTKDFTFVAVTQLVEEGRLALDAPIGAYLARLPADKRAITVRQLLLHRGGLPGNLGPDFAPVSKEEFLNALGTAPLLFAPGEGRQYSNSGYSLLAALIEHVTGETYERVLERRIFAPLEMRDTGGVLHAWDGRRIAHGYRLDGSDHGHMMQKPMAKDGAHWNLRGNGGLLSTVGDMHRFYAALNAGQLIRAEHRDLLYQPDEAVSLSGSDGTFSFTFAIDPTSASEVLVGASTQAISAMQVARRIVEALRSP